MTNRKLNALIGRKIGCTQIFNSEGVVVPVTVLKVGPCVVLEKKSQYSKHGYNAIKLGFEPVPERRVNKPLLGWFNKLKIQPHRIVREFRVPQDQLDLYKVGQKLNVSIFEPGDYVNVTAKSKGRGFSGVVKRHGFRTPKESHGTHEYFRHPGSVGCSTYPAKIWKGQRMPGHYGNQTVTTENLQVVQVIPDKNLLLLKGAVPGHRNSLVLVKSSRKKWKRAEPAD